MLTLAKRKITPCSGLYSLSNTTASAEGRGNGQNEREQYATGKALKVSSLGVDPVVSEVMPPWDCSDNPKKKKMVLFKLECY